MSSKYRYVLEVSCRTCHAKPLQKCVTNTGYEVKAASQSHASRMRDARVNKNLDR